jgi:hypothetical protein
MHPVAIQTITAERSWDLRAQMSAARRAQEIRRSQPARWLERLELFTHILRTGQGPASLPPRPLRGPGTA